MEKVIVFFMLVSDGTENHRDLNIVRLGQVAKLTGAWRRGH
jgi:hypothetical protein